MEHIPVAVNPNKPNWRDKFELYAWFSFIMVLEKLVRDEAKINFLNVGKSKKITYVELLPLDADNQTPQYSEHTNKKTGVTYLNYKTNNPKAFWTKPE